MPSSCILTFAGGVVSVERWDGDSVRRAENPPSCLLWPSRQPRPLPHAPCFCLFFRGLRFYKPASCRFFAGEKIFSDKKYKKAATRRGSCLPIFAMYLSTTRYLWFFVAKRRFLLYFLPPNNDTIPTMKTIQKMILPIPMPPLSNTAHYMTNRHNCQRRNMT